jgi:hypothetical protein
VVPNPRDEILLGQLIGFASGKSLDLSTFSTPDGKLAQYLIQ